MGGSWVGDGGIRRRFSVATMLALVVLTVGPRDVSGQAPVNTGGKRTIRAVRIAEMLTLDGRVDEPQWQLAPPATDFQMKEPRDDRPATEKTEVRILYNETFLYVGAICYDSEPDKILVSELTEDHATGAEDAFAILFDTFNDAQNDVQFETNPAGSRTDFQHAGNGAIGNRDWDAIWYVKTTRRPDGWSAEFAFPLKSLRFTSAAEQIWGVNFRRRIRRKNEEGVWNPIPRSQNFWTPSLAGRLEGLRDIRPGRNLYFKPYALGGIDDLRRAAPRSTHDLGLDVKYGITNGLTLDATYRTDFAQAEVDQQQVNLTRFSLFFPEKREFFLENSGLFSFGGQSSTAPGGGGFGGGGSVNVTRPAAFGTNDFILFFSRRIGLSAAGAPVPIDGGVRLTGQLPRRTEIGVLNITSGDAPGIARANNTVVKLRKNLLRSSDVGFMFVDRESEGHDFTRVLGVEQNLRFFANALNVNAFWARASTPATSSGNQAWGAAASWRDRMKGGGASYREIQANFNNDAGYVRRKDIREAQAYATLFLRPRSDGPLGQLREIGPQISLDYVMNGANQLVTRALASSADVFFQNGSRLILEQSWTFDRVDRTFVLGPGVAVPRGDYRVNETKAEYTSDESRKVAAHTLLTRGAFYGGNKNTTGIGLLFRPTYHVMFKAEYTRNTVDLPSRSFVSNLEALTANFGLTPELSLNAVVQYNSDVRQVVANVRFRYNYRPWNDFYIVYNETHDTFGLGERDRSLILKLTYSLGL